MLAVDIEETHQGAMEALGARRGDLKDMQPDGKGRVRLDYRIPARGPDRLPVRIPDDDARHRRHEPRVRRIRPDEAGDPERRNGVLISAENGEAVAYALWKLQERGRMFVIPASRSTKAWSSASTAATTTSW